MKVKLIVFILAIALVSYFCGFGASLAITKSITPNGTTAAHQSNALSKPARAQLSPSSLAAYQELVSFSNNVFVGSQAAIRIRTHPGSVCTIRYVNPEHQEESLESQVFQITGDDGMCGWSWTIPAETTPGYGVVYIWAGGLLQQYTFTITK